MTTTINMLSSTRRNPIERPPSRIAGVVYIIIGILALLVAAFILFYQGSLGAITNIRIGFGAVIAAYGLFRIFTGISMIRRAKNFVELGARMDAIDGKDENSQANKNSAS